MYDIKGLIKLKIFGIGGIALPLWLRACNDVTHPYDTLCYFSCYALFSERFDGSWCVSHPGS